MKKMKTLFAIAALFLMASAFTSCTRIDAGHCGIKVKLYGSDKGVQDITEVTGWVWYNPFTTKVYEVPTFVQNAVYTADETEGSPENEEFRVTSKDGLVVSFDVSMNYLTPADQVPAIFRKYRKPPEDLNKSIIRNYLREAFNNTASQYTAEMLYEKRSEFEAKADTAIRTILEPEGFIIEQVVILNEIRLPTQVVTNIAEKVNATQIAIKKQQEVAQARADADKKIENARGYAESVKIMAAADKFTYEQKTKSLNSLLIQQQFIEKWNGVLPVYGTVPTIFKNIN